jgi:hypothetical protein
MFPRSTDMFVFLNVVTLNSTSKMSRLEPGYSTGGRSTFDLTTLVLMSMIDIGSQHTILYIASQLPSINVDGLKYLGLTRRVGQVRGTVST